MCVMKMLWRACAALWCPGRVLGLCVLLDTLYLARVLHAASVAPLDRDDASDSSLNTTSAASSRPSPLARASHLAAPSAALLPPSSSSSVSSSSRTAEDLHSGNATWNETGPAQGSNSSQGLADAARKPGAKRKHSAAASPGGGGGVRKEFPLALVVASATAAVSIVLFFCFSYLWHTRQLDRRAQKLAIRLAAEVNSDLKCAQCRPMPTFRIGARAGGGDDDDDDDDSGSESGGEDSRVFRLPAATLLDDVSSLNEDDEEEAEDGSRRKPGGVGRTLGTKKAGRGRGRRSESKSSRHSSGHARSSLVTDQEILTHFASRRHSTFFI